jgi:hypothetical protein
MPHPTDEVRDEVSALLPYPVTFVCLDHEYFGTVFRDINRDLLDPDSLESHLRSESSWGLRTYLNLKREHFNVEIATRLAPGKICVVLARDLQLRPHLADSFVVGCCADHGKSVISDIEIVQNSASVESDTDILVPHWPQPGLTPRGQERGNRIENLVYKGRSHNLYHEFRSPEFNEKLTALGVRLSIDDEKGREIPDWGDFRTADLVLAVRDLTERDALLKPASKLVNAWIAGSPALLGPEPAFRELRESHLDYIEVRTVDDVLDAIRRLKSDPALYHRMIANGFKRAEDFTRDRIVKRWVEVLSGPVADHYRRWLKEGRVRRLAKFPLRAIQQKMVSRATATHREQGYRIVSGRHT